MRRLLEILAAAFFLDWLWRAQAEAEQEQHRAMLDDWRVMMQAQERHWQAVDDPDGVVADVQAFLGL